MTPAELAAIRQRATGGWPTSHDVLDLLAEVETLTHERDEERKRVRHQAHRLRTVRAKAHALAALNDEHWPDSVQVGRWLLTLIGEDDGD